MQFNRILQNALVSSTSRGKARLILGARQTGKSTLFRLIQPQASGATFLLDLQDRAERSRFARDPALLTRTLLAPGSRMRHVLIDEVQRVPDLLDEIQLVLDRNPGRFTFTLTGSSAHHLRRSGANLLPGRTHRYFLSPVCRWEQEGGNRGTFLRWRGRFPRNPFPARPLEETLVLGSLPAAFTEGDAFRKTLESYAEIYVEEEVLREMAARNLGSYSRFLELAAMESGKPINLTKISQESGIALSTIRGFYRVLEDTLLGFTVPPYTGSGKARILRTPKFYFFDVGVRNAVARLPLDPRILVTEGGNLFEHWVACELMARIGYVGRFYRLSFWRTVDGAEVDFILETPGESFPIEVKFTRNPRPEDARSIENFLVRYPKKARRGFLICRCPRPEQLTDHVVAIPWEYL